MNRATQPGSALATKNNDATPAAAWIEASTCFHNEKTRFQ
jgi:hypothetical protein